MALGTRSSWTLPLRILLADINVLGNEPRPLQEAPSPRVQEGPQLPRMGLRGPSSTGGIPRPHPYPSSAPSPSDGNPPLGQGGWGCTQPLLGLQVPSLL